MDDVIFEFKGTGNMEHLTETVDRRVFLQSTSINPGPGRKSCWYHRPI
jgi:transcription termination factor Rho